MKLIALQRISEQVQAGVAFEIPDHDVESVNTLILAGMARKADDASTEPSPTRRTYRRRDQQAEE